MAVFTDAFWSRIDRKSTAYKSKVRVIRRWKQKCQHIDEMVSKTRTALIKRSHGKGAAKTLSCNAEMDIIDWILTHRPHGVPVSAKMLELEDLSIE
ncbi:hypothetical protein JG688_00011360 [Phytophthora aleatoria]|uniref:HTH CENPB-type domain-containing protein n=1 Tax=Phytophthora aleatoria TaxID=2496075 RepID=A0A8J5ID50_9STRA|nr:hypothetical protein JG688_00011360 [Phytophthora aleatoria]